jgi:antitoxin VapB
MENPWDGTMTSLRIKSEETHRLVKELAKLTGESLTTAVTVALRERLANLEKENRPAHAKPIAGGSSVTVPAGRRS